MSLAEAAARRSFLRATAVLASGTAAAQGVMFLAMLILPRFYSPADFGTLAVYTAIVGTIGVAASLRFDVALALPEDEREAVGLLVLALASATAIATAVLVASVAVPALRGLLPAETQNAVSWLLAPGVLAFAVLSVLQNWRLRAREFSEIARARIGQTFAASGIQVAGGAAGGGGLLLVTGLLAGYVGGAALLTRRLVGVIRRWLASAAPGELSRLASQYRRFPRFSTWEALANNAGIQLPVVLIASRASVAEAGFVAWAMYVMQAPMGLLGSAVAQAYLSGAPQEHGRGRLGQYTLDVLTQLTALGLGPLVALAVLAPAGFPIVFGGAWERAGWLVAWMMPWFFLQLLASPISMALHVTGRQRTALTLQVVGLVVRVSAVLGCAAWWPSLLSEGYALSGAAFYALYLVVVLRAVGISVPQYWAATRRALGWTAVWAAGATAVLLLLGALRQHIGVGTLIR